MFPYIDKRIKELSNQISILLDEAEDPYLRYNRKKKRELYDQIDVLETIIRILEGRCI
ncbi:MULTISPECIES: hypothetical protein [Lysinibacillus]|uniref:hypothetical protein n=1 Tax=Lysinibacillus TaxID=400634 RepID=UPI00214B83CC|nr:MULTISPECIES: hypothetical protein [Lysinibacillus]UUV25985.1 hypothetical protein NP781_05020 [Lysinibacillus sp. FN11]UYB48858.1 hypothetical protein OCI51_07810 [Lysinibacillus capsici]